MDISRALTVWNTIYILALAVTVIATFFVTHYSRRLNSDANRRIAEVELESEQIRNENSQLQLQIERERTQRLRLEEEVAPRRLSEDAIKLMSDFLSIHPSHTVDIHVFIGTDDGVAFATDIAVAFHSAGWETGRRSQTTSYGDLRGVSVAVKDWMTAPDKARIAAQALEHGRLQLTRITDPRLDDDEVRIVISPKR